MSGTIAPRFGLYIHWPFCAAKCPYCDFNSHVSQQVDYARWEEAMAHEIKRLGGETGERVLQTIFFGGGTPSLMPPSLVDAILSAAHDTWRWANDIEITLEANPTSIEVNNLKALRLAGVNRVSMGVQALNDEDLRRLGRMHSAKEALAGLDTAQNTFDRVSIDLIYARQDQSAPQWEEELKSAIALGLKHFSFYQLTIEPGTVFAKQFERGRLKGLPDEDLSIELWDITQDLTAEAGLPQYETSNHASPGHEARHNLIYWTGGDWAAMGPGAHGRLTLGGQRYAIECARHPDAWLERVEKTGSGETLRDALSMTDVIDERVLMGLRLVDGLDLADLKRLGWAPPARRLGELIDEGFLAMTDERLIVTPEGRPLLNAVIERLLT